MDVKVWAVRSLAVVLAVAMIFVVSVSKPGRNAAADVGVAVGGPNSEPPPSTTGVTTTNLVASNLPPNVVFILADDLGYHSLNVDVSPFLMQMRGNGVILSKYYSQEVCTPARAALLTGRYPISVGWQKNEASVIETGGLGLAETTLAEVLKSKGYTTFMFGKWNLGNSSPRYLPTARGFDYFLGYLDGFSNYWSKTDPTYPDYHDIMYSDNQCYFMYDWDDMNQYSSFLYRDKAIEAIEMHNFSASPMFMYLAFQAVHDPFGDSDDRYGKGIPKEYMESSRYAYISNMVEGNINQEYNKALALMDASIESIYSALDSRGVLDNTYIIFASDNGGCPASGGKNTPLRGSKGSLFEGGVKVDSFIYGRSLLDHSVVGQTYDGLFHVSDWFPTILSMIGSPDFTPISGYELDGVDQWPVINRGVVPGSKGADVEYPRKYLLLNYYFNPGKLESDTNSFWQSSPGAIRDERWKLMHTYDSATAGTWYSESEMSYNGDDNLQEKGGCTQAAAWENGDFTFFLFDLENDPYETTNLYDRTTEAKAKQLELYLQMDSMTSKAAAINNDRKVTTCYAAWQSSGNYIVPWDEPEAYASLMIPDSSIRAVHGARAYPANCGMYSQAFISARITPYHSNLLPDEPREVVLPTVGELPFDGPGQAPLQPGEEVAGPVQPAEAIPGPLMTSTEEGAEGAAASEGSDATASTTSASESTESTSSATASATASESIGASDNVMMSGVPSWAMSASDVSAAAAPAEATKPDFAEETVPVVVPVVETATEETKAEEAAGAGTGAEESIKAEAAAKEAIAPADAAAEGEAAASDAAAGTAAAITDDAVKQTLGLFGFSANAHVDAVQQALAAFDSKEPTAAPVVSPSDKPTLPPTSKPVWTSKVQW